MIRFSNINWAAFLLSGLWGWFNRFPLWTFLWILALFSPGISARVGDVYIGNEFTALLGFVVLSALSVFLALCGNRILLKDICKKGLSAEEEQKERATASLQQQTQMAYGFGHKVFLYFVASYSALTIHSFRAVSVLFVIDMLALTLVLSMALLSNAKENELYPEEKFTFNLAWAKLNVASVRRPRRQKAKTIEYSDWNPFDEKKDAHIKEAKIEQRRNEQIRIEQKRIEDERKRIVQETKEHQMSARKQRLENEDFLTEDTWDIFVPQDEEQAESAAK